jgi:hypothetical protein
MNVATLEIDRCEAKAQYAYYRSAVRDGVAGQPPDVARRLRAEFSAAQRILWHAMKGRRILKLGDSMRLGGVDDAGRPRFAIARADREFVWARASNWNERQGGEQVPRGRVVFHSETREGKPRGNTAIVRTHDTDRIYVRLPGHKLQSGDHLRAVVPNVPPHLLPSVPLRNFWTLWEPVWEPVAPADPFLLSWIDGDAFAVLAQWDLTPVEKLVLERRFQ